MLKFHGGKPRLGLEPSVPCNYGIPGAEQPFQSFQLALGMRIPCCCLERAAPQSPGSLECRLGTFGIIPNPSPASWPCWRQKLPAGAAAPSPTPESPSPALPGVSFHFHPVMGALETLGILRTPEKREEWELSSGSAATPEYSKGSSPSGAVFLKYFSVDPQQFWQETPPPFLTYSKPSRGSWDPPGEAKFGKHGNGKISVGKAPAAVGVRISAHSS